MPPFSLGAGRAAKEKTTLGGKFKPERYSVIECIYGHGYGRPSDDVGGGVSETAEVFPPRNKKKGSSVIGYFREEFHLGKAKMPSTNWRNLRGSSFEVMIQTKLRRICICRA